MDGRDIVCIMPTGMNRELDNSATQSHQRWWKIVDLPASGSSHDRMYPCYITADISNDRSNSPSPRSWRYVSELLLSWSFTHFKVPAAMITSTTSETEKKQTLQRLQMLTERSVNRAEKEIKLVYVTVRGRNSLDCDDLLIH
jgi:hypothetical protein